MDDKDAAIFRIEQKLNEITIELKDHKERHAMVINMLSNFAKFTMGLTTFFTLIGGGCFGIYKLIKGE